MGYKGFRFDVLARKMGFDDLELGYVFSRSASLDRGEDDDTDFVRQTWVTLYGRNRDDNGEVTREIRLGEFMFWHFRGDYASDVGADIVDEADAISQDVYNAAVVLYGEFPEPTPDRTFRMGLVDKFNAAYGQIMKDALYLHKMYLRPEVRGYGLSEAIFQRAIEQVGGRVQCVVASPRAGWHPDVQADDPLYGRDEKEGQRALEQLFNHMGFMPVEGWPDYVVFEGSIRDWRQERWTGRPASEARKVRGCKLLATKAA